MVDAFQNILTENRARIGAAGECPDEMKVYQLGVENIEQNFAPAINDQIMLFLSDLV